MNKMRSGISRGVQMLEKLCNKKRSRGGSNSKHRVIDSSNSSSPNPQLNHTESSTQSHHKVTKNSRNMQEKSLHSSPARERKTTKTRPVPPPLSTRSSPSRNTFFRLSRHVLPTAPIRPTAPPFRPFRLPKTRYSARKKRDFFCRFRFFL